MSHIFSKEDIFSQLRSLGVPTDKPVTVHSSLKAVGELESRGEGFLDMLIEYVTSDGGLLCIPTHTWHRCGGAVRLPVPRCGRAELTARHETV